MVRKTPNHDLNVYEQGDTDWTHAPDMETIERRLVVRDVRDSLEEYDPHEGATFVATDSGAVFDGDGEEWSKASREYAGADVDDLRTGRTPVADVRAYGAAGDGEGDDTDAIREAIESDAAVAYLPKGTYRITDELSLGSTTLRGDGMGASTLALDEERERALTVDGEGGGLTDLSLECDGRAIQGVVLTAAHAFAERVAVDHVDQWGAEEGSTACINVMSAPHATVADCRATRARAPNTGISNGIHVAGEDGGAVTITRCHVDDVTPKADGDGIVVQGENDGTRVIGNHVTNAAKSALKINRPSSGAISVLATGNTLQADADCMTVARIQGTETTFAGNTIVQERVGDAALRVSTDPNFEGAPVTVTGNVVELTDPADGNDLIRVRDWDRTVVINDNTLKLHGGGSRGIRVDGSENVVINGNAIDQVGSTGVEVAGTVGASITGNVIDEAGGAGIAIDGEAARCVVTGNVLGDTDGISVAEGAGDVAVGTNVGD